MESSTTTKQKRKTTAELAGRILLLATLVATVTYATGFNMPGGVWQETAGHLPGDPILRSTQYVRYMIFFYCNATAFASSLMVFALLLLLVFASSRGREKLSTIIIPLVLVMLLALLSLIGAYAAGTFRGRFTAIYTSLLVAAVITYVSIQMFAAPDKEVQDADADRVSRLCKMMMQLATFALTVSYGGGLSTPGGFWDSTEDGHRPGDTITSGARLTAFFVSNTTAFGASVLIVVVLLMNRIGRTRTVVAFSGSVVMLFGLLGSYLAGCGRRENAVFFACLIGAILAYIPFQVSVERIASESFKAKLRGFHEDIVSRLFKARRQTEYDRGTDKKEQEKYSSYIQYLATLALTITYQAGLDPPGGYWQYDGDGHRAGDPILRTTNPRRYNAFFYCNSVAFVASLVCMMLVQIRPLLKHRALEQAMILDLLSLVGAYAIGSSRDETTTVYAMGIGGAGLVYVILHVVLLDKKDIHERITNDPLLSRHYVRMSAGLFIFAILVATISYQAGLSPPGGCFLTDDKSGHRAGDPVLLYNYPRRYRVFFYCNSTSFMVSIAIIILLVNPSIYQPALQTHALSICTAVSFFCLLAAFAAGSTQYMKNTIYTLVLMAVVLLFASLLVLFLSLAKFLVPSVLPTISTIPSISLHINEEENAVSSMPTSTLDPDQLTEERRNQLRQRRNQLTEERRNQLTEERRTHRNRMYLMTIGILVASVTYQAGLDPPGGSWQGRSNGHNAGDPVMMDTRRQRYHAFFYANSTSFVSSIFLMLLLLVLSSTKKQSNPALSRVLYTMIALDFLGLLGAYAAGSGSDWKTFVNVISIVVAMLAYFSIHILLSLLWPKGGEKQDTDDPQGPDQSPEPHS